MGLWPTKDPSTPTMVVNFIIVPSAALFGIVDNERPATVAMMVKTVDATTSIPIVLLEFILFTRTLIWRTNLIMCLLTISALAMLSMAAAGGLSLDTCTLDS